MRNIIVLILLIISEVCSSQCNISINGASNKSVCQNGTLNLQTSGSAGLTYQWYSNSSASNTGGTSIGGASSSSFSVNTVNAGTFYYYVVGTAASPACIDTSGVVTVIVNPLASISNLTSSVCSGNQFSVSPTNGVNGTIPSGTTYTWTVSNPNVTGESNNSSGSSNISQTLSQSSNTAQSVVYNVTPTSGTCTGNLFTITVSVNPVPVITPMSASVCSGLAFNVTPVNSTNGTIPSGTLYTWVVSNSNVTGESNSTNASSSIGQTLSQVTNVSQSVVYNVTPTAGSCQGAVFNLTVSVDPVPSISNMTASSCSGSLFTSNPTNGTNGVVPAGTTYSWTVSAPNVTGESNVSTATSNISQTLSHTQIIAQSAVYSVTPTSASCVGSNYSLTVTVNPTPAISAASETICSGELFSADFQSTSGNIIPVGTIYDWTVGLNSNVNGESNAQNQNVVSQTLTNISNTAQTVTYSVIPESGNCQGTQFAVTVSVNPVPSLPNLSAIICEGSDYSFTPINGGVAIVPNSTSLTWTGAASNLEGLTNNDTPVSTFVQNLSNTTISQQNATYTVIPSTQYCEGLPFQITLGVNSRPEISAMETSICSGDAFLVNPTNGIDGIIPNLTNYSWNAIPNPNISNEVNGSSITSISQLLSSSTDIETNMIYQVTPSFAGCAGPVFDLDVLVRPMPMVNDVFTQVCNGEIFEVSPISGNGNIVPSGTTYTWTYLDNFNLLNEQNGENSVSVSGNLSVLNYSDQSIQYNVLPASEFCEGSFFAVNVLVQKTPNLVTIEDQFICSGESVQLYATDLFAVPNTVYNWTLSQNVESLNFPYISNPIAAPSETTTYIVTMVDPTHVNCTSSDTVVVTVVSLIIIDAGVDQTICEGASVQLELQGAGEILWEPSTGLTSVNSTNPIASPNATTTYHATVSDEIYGCISEDDVTIYVVSNPEFSIQAPDEVCQYSEVGFEVSGASADWTFEWLNASGDVLGVSEAVAYTADTPGQEVIFLNATSSEGCVGIAQKQVHVNVAPTPSIGGPNVVCANSYWQPYQVNSSGSSYNWSIENGELTSGVGTNEILVHWFLGSEGQLSVVEHEFVNGCEGSSILNVELAGTAPDMQEVLVLSESFNTLYCPNNSFSYYKWGYTSIQTGVDAFVGQNETYATYSVFDPTNYYYWVDLGDDLTCLTRSYYNLPEIVYSVAENTLQGALEIYPNPSYSGYVDLKINADNYQLGNCQVWSADGKLVRTHVVTNGLNRIDTTALSEGVYLFKILLSNGDVINRTIIIQ